VSIISISGLSYTFSETITERVSSRLAYRCIADEVFQEAAERLGISRATHEKAFTESSGLFGMSAATRKVYTAHIRSTLATHFLQDHGIYGGPFGVHLIRGVSHLLNVRIRAELEDRVKLKVERDACSSSEARSSIIKEDQQRRALAEALFSADDDDDHLFDLVINTSNMTVEKAADVIADTVGMSRYKPMTYSVGCLEAQELANRIIVALIDLDPDVDVRVDAGNVQVRLTPRGLMRKKKVRLARQRAARIEGVKNVTIQVLDDLVERTGSR